jgi:hypothetical protein
MRVRRITIKLKVATRDGETALHISRSRKVRGGIRYQ